jgi:hypothetical protein
MKAGLAFFAAVALLAALGGCAGTKTPAIETGTLRSSIERTYASAACPQLTEGLKAELAALKADEDRERQERTAAPSTLWRGLQRTLNPNEIHEPSAEAFEKDRQAALLINEKLAVRGCPTIDIDGELTQARWSGAAEIVKGSAAPAVSQ